MTLAAIASWAASGQILVAAGIATWDVIAGWIKQMHGTAMTEAELNIILEMLKNEDMRRLLVRQSEAAGPLPVVI